MSSAEEIVQVLNGKRSGNGWVAHCPAHDDQDPSLSINESPDGMLLFHCHAGCTQEAVIGALQARGIWTYAKGGEQRAKSDEEGRQDYIKWLLSKCHRISDSISESLRRYLTNRGLSEKAQLPSLLFHPRMKYKEEGKLDSYHCAMVTEIRDVEGRLVGVHRTYLGIDGKKAPVAEPKKTFGQLKGGAIRLTPCKNVLSLAEGIETALAVFDATTIPTWAAISARGMEAFLCPAEITTIHIWADLDVSSTGLNAANALAARLSTEGKTVFIHIPNGPIPDGAKGVDWCDVLADRTGGKEAFTESLKQVRPWGADRTDGSKESWKTKQTRRKFELVSLAELLRKPTDNIHFLVENSLSAGGTSVWAGKPKVGKTTLVRYLALCVASGSKFLGKEVSKGPVIYLALEEKESEIKRHFTDMGATGSEDILIHATSAPAGTPEEILDQLYQLIVKHKPALVIGDTLFKLVRVKDVNEYAAVNNALEPLANMARVTGVHILLVHHMGKAEREGADGILGSTAIAGAVDALFMIKRAKNRRTISSQQRYGVDLEESLLIFDAESRTFTLGDTIDGEDDGDIESAILIFLRERGVPVAEKEILEQVQGKRITKVHTLRAMVRAGSVLRSGGGRKGDPFKYYLPNDDFDGPRSSQENGNQNPHNPFSEEVVPPFEENEEMRSV